MEYLKNIWEEKRLVLNIKKQQDEERMRLIRKMERDRVEFLNN